MTEPTWEPEKITSPIQLLAIWFSALVLLDGSFLTAASLIEDPSWASAVLVISAILMVPVFLSAAFVMQTRFRPHLQEDKYFSEWQKRQEELFKGFEAENLQIAAPRPGDHKPPVVATFERRESLRIQLYEERAGLFLVHAWRPSERESGWADVVLWIHQHGDGPLSQGRVERVEYQLGGKFFKGVVEKRNADTQFRLDVAAYGPFLCLAWVYVAGREDPIQLERYVDIRDAPE